MSVAIDRKKKRIAIDFDGVIHKYSKGWGDGIIYDDPVDNMETALVTLAEDFDLVIFTCRVPCVDVYEWIKERTGLRIEVTNTKPHADMYIDDRGYHFMNWDDCMEELYKRKDHDFKMDYREASWEWNR